MKFLTALCLALISSSVAMAAESPLIGTWKLQSVHRVATAGGQSTEPYGANPEGVLTFTADGRMIGIIIPAAKDASGAAIPRNLVAYSGPYTSEGPGKVEYHVDISISPTQKGTVTARTYTLEGDKLTLVTIPAKDAQGVESKTVLEWKRLKGAL